MAQTPRHWIKAQAAGEAPGTAAQKQSSRLRAELAGSLGAASWQKRRRTSRRGSVRYDFVERRTRVWPVCVQCRVLLVACPASPARAAAQRSAQRRHLSDEALLVHIGAVFAAHRGAYGWPRVWRQFLCLASMWVCAGAAAFGGITFALVAARFRVVTSDACMAFRTARPARSPSPWLRRPGRAGGVLISLREVWLYLAVVVELLLSP